MNVKIRLTFCYCFILSIAFSQNKKEQIDALNFSIDSLEKSVNNERIAFAKSIVDLEIQISKLKIDSAQLHSDLNANNTQLALSLNKLKSAEQSLNGCNDSIKTLSQLNETNNLSKYKIFCFKDIMEIDSWSGHVSVIGALIGDRVEFLQIEDNIRELNKNEYTSFQIPKEATAAIVQYYTGGEGIIYSTVDAEYFRIYSGGRGEEETKFEVELLKEYKID